MENNFKTIKNSVTRIIFESVNTGNDNLTSLWKGFINEVNNSPVLKTLYIVYNNIENNKFSNRDVAEMFLNENLISFGGFSKKQIIDENVKIKSMINEHITEESSDDLFELILESTKDRKLSNLGKKAELFNKVAETLVESEVILEDVAPTQKIETAVLTRAIDLLNEKYSFLDDVEKGILKAFLNDDEEKKENYFNTLVNENLNIIKRLIIESDEENEEYELLKLTEEKLNQLEYSKDTPIGKFSELISFQKD